MYFQTHLFSVLPPSFAGGFKRLIEATLTAFTHPEENIAPEIRDIRLWHCFDELGLTERYEALIASVCYEHIERHVTEMCAHKWDEPMLGKLRDWMADKVMKWMFRPYAPMATNGNVTSSFRLRFEMLT